MACWVSCVFAILQWDKNSTCEDPCEVIDCLWLFLPLPSFLEWKFKPEIIVQYQILVIIIKLHHFLVFVCENKIQILNLCSRSQTSEGTQIPKKLLFIILLSRHKGITGIRKP